MKKVLIGFIRFYQTIAGTLKLLLGGQTCPCCRFTPTCSEYAIGAIHEHGAWKGSLLAARRILRCHPWAKWGYDPVPARVSSATKQGGRRG